MPIASNVNVCFDREALTFCAFCATATPTLVTIDATGALVRWLIWLLVVTLTVDCDRRKSRLGDRGDDLRPTALARGLCPVTLAFYALERFMFTSAVVNPRRAGRPSSSRRTFLNVRFLSSGDMCRTSASRSSPRGEPFSGS